MSAHAPTAVCPTGTVRTATAPVRVPRGSAAERVAADVAARLAAALHAWARWRRMRDGLAELRALDERMLADIGIDRGGVDRAARRGRR